MNQLTKIKLELSQGDLKLTEFEIKDLFIILDRVSVTGRQEARALVLISEKLELQLQELLKPKEDDKN